MIDDDNPEDPPRPSERVLAQEVLRGDDAQQVLDYLYAVSQKERAIIVSGEGQQDADCVHAQRMRTAFSTACTSTVLLLPALTMALGAWHVGARAYPVGFVGALSFVLFGFLGAMCWFEWHTLRAGGLPSAAMRVLVGHVETVPKFCR